MVSLSALWDHWLHPMSGARGELGVSGARTECEQRRGRSSALGQRHAFTLSVSIMMRTSASVWCRAGQPGAVAISGIEAVIVRAARRSSGWIADGTWDATDCQRNTAPARICSGIAIHSKSVELDREENAKELL